MTTLLVDALAQSLSRYVFTQAQKEREFLEFQFSEMKTVVPLLCAGGR